MQVNGIGVSNSTMTDVGIVEAIKEFEDSGEGQVDVDIGNEVVVISFTSYHCNDGDAHWVLLKDNCSNKLIESLTPPK